MLKSFEKLQKMTDDNLDIRLAPLANISKVDINKTHGSVTINVDLQTARDLMDNSKKYVGGFLIANKEIYDNLEN